MLTQNFIVFQLCNIVIFLMFIFLGFETALLDRPPILGLHKRFMIRILSLSPIIIPIAIPTICILLIIQWMRTKNKNS